MEKVYSSDDLFAQIGKMNRGNSVCQVYIPGKGKFTIVLQEEDMESISSEINLDSDLLKMIQESRKAYQAGDTMGTVRFDSLYVF